MGVTVTLRPVALSAVLALACTGGAWAAPTRATDAGVQTIRVTSVSTKLANHDAAPKGTSAGDTVEYKDTLVNAVGAQFGKAKGTVVGKDSGTLTFTSASSAVFDGLATFPTGTIILKGQVYSLTGGGFAIPIAGGTGAFAHVVGTMTIGSGTTKVANVYRFTRSKLPVA